MKLTLRMTTANSMVANLGNGIRPHWNCYLFWFPVSTHGKSLHLPSIVNVHLSLTRSPAYAVIEFVYRL
jgi:hypothetical protein